VREKKNTQIRKFCRFDLIKPFQAALTSFVKRNLFMRIAKEDFLKFTLRAARKAAMREKTSKLLKKILRSLDALIKVSPQSKKFPEYIMSCFFASVMPIDRVQLSILLHSVKIQKPS